MKSPIFFLFLVLFPIVLSAQDEEKTKFPLEKFYVERKKNRSSFLNKLVFGVSTGGGNTFFSHETTGFGIYQLNGQPPTLFDLKDIPAGVVPSITQLNAANRYTNWINDVNQTTIDIPATSDITITTDPLTGRGSGFNVPLKLTVHYEYKQFRLGAGYSYELMALSSFNLSSASTEKSYDTAPSGTLGFMSRYFGIIGYSFYRYNKYLATVDANIGNFSPGTNFNSSLIEKGLYYNLGLTMEREFSEYFKVFARPSIEIKSYSIALPPSGKSVDHAMKALYLNIGVTYRIPELPKCYHKYCRVQINHAHGNKEYRSRDQKFYEIQNPGYGENDPVLIKYKGKNKRKLNPY